MLENQVTSVLKKTLINLLLIYIIIDINLTINKSNKNSPQTDPQSLVNAKKQSSIEVPIDSLYS